MRRDLAFLVLAFFYPAFSFAQTSYDMSNAAETGEKILGSYFATDIDSVSLKNGNLYLNIPLFSLPGRELPVSLSVAYNSRGYEWRTTYDEFGNPTSAYAYNYWSRAGLLGGELTAVKTLTSSTSYPQPITQTWKLDFYWVEPNRTKHMFSTSRTLNCDSLQMGRCFSNTQGFLDVTIYDDLTLNSTESDSIQLQTGTYFNGSNSTATLTLRDGTKVQWTNAAAPQISVITLNGNKLTATKNWPTSLPTSDTTGRSIGYSLAGTVETITLQDSNGQNKTYVINTPARSGMDPTNTTPVTIYGVTYITLPNGRQYTFDYDTVGRVTKVTLPSGAYIRYTYIADAVFSPGTGWLVSSRIVSADGTAGSEKTWTYATGIEQTPPYPGTITVTAPDGTTEVHTFWTGMREIKIQNKDAAGNLLKRIDKSWQSQNTDSFGNPVDYQVTTETTTIGDRIKQSSATYDSNNNLVQQDEYDFGVNVVGPLLSHTAKTYLGGAYTTAHIFNRIASDAIHLGSASPQWWDASCPCYRYYQATPTAQTQWEYDNYTAQPLVTRAGTIPGWADPGTTVRANATGVKRWLNTTSTWLTTGQQFDVLGNLVKVTDPGGHATNTDFTDKFSDSISRNSFAYATRVTDPTGFYVDTTYDFKTGLVKQTTDSLNRTTTMTYDLMNRSTQTNLPHGGRTTYAYDDLTPKTTKEVLVDALNNVGRVITTFDKLYRVIKTETADPAGNIFVETQYDSKGRKWKVSNPYRTGDTVLWTQFQYDAIDRPTITTAVDNSTVQYAYSGNKTTVTDEAGNPAPLHLRRTRAHDAGRRAESHARYAARHQLCL